MPVRATVVLRATAEGGGDDWLAPVVHGLDLQSWPADAFEVLAVARPGTSQAGRLADLAARRTNVRVVGDDADPAAQARGDWYLDLGDDVHERRLVLQPDALALLVEAGERTGADVVVGRTADTGTLAAVDALVPADGDPSADALGALVGATDHLRPLVLTRTKLVTERDGGPTGGSAVAAVTATVCATTSAPIAVPAQQLPSGGPARDVTASWSDGVLTVSARFAAASPGARVVLGVRDAETGLEVFLPTRTTVTTAVDGDDLVGTATFDVRTAAGGATLPRAVWDVTAGVHGDGAQVSARTVVPQPVAGLPAAAVVDGTPVVPVGSKAAFRLDVGGWTASVVGTADPAQAVVTESGRGTLLVLRLPHVHATGDSTARGQLRLGTFGIPADLVVSGGEVRLECWLTGLAGSSNLSVHFGKAPVPIGLTLDVDEVGTMTVRRTIVKKPSPAAAAAKKAAPKPKRGPQPPPSTALAARLRRAVRRTPLEPVVASLRRNETARAVYRRLIGR